MTKIEEVARAICRTEHVIRFGDAIWRTGELDVKVEAHWIEHIPAARSAIEAMREPIQEMIDAANALPVTKVVNALVTMTALRYGRDTGLEGPPNTPLQQWWRAMIEAALKEKG